MQGFKIRSAVLYYSKYAIFRSLIILGLRNIPVIISVKIQSYKLIYFRRAIIRPPSQLPHRQRLLYTNEFPKETIDYSWGNWGGMDIITAVGSL